ncbi:MAG: sugar nucleotide-binding protein, partial [Maribacter sp.]
NEEDAPNPLNIYGDSKLKGEKHVLDILKKFFIIRTSWVYSEYGHNFLKTMLRLGSEKKELSVVCDQIGTPTYAKDLANVLLTIIKEEKSEYGIYHYSNEGIASWYDFAKAIFDDRNINIKVLPINTEAYPTPANRPTYSVMDKSKIKSVFGIEIPYWRESLKKVISQINSLETES